MTDRRRRKHSETLAGARAARAGAVGPVPHRRPCRPRDTRCGSGTARPAGRELGRHIAWDIGMAGVDRTHVGRAGCHLVLQTYSRLVIDCNRDAGGGELDPGDQRGDRDPRQQRTWRPSSARPATGDLRALPRSHPRRAGRAAGGAADARVLAMHSFTPVFKGESRAMQVGVLYNRDPRLPRSCCDAAAGRGRSGGRRQRTLRGERRHRLRRSRCTAEKRGLPHVEMEIRQDLIADEAGQQAGRTAGRLLARPTRASTATRLKRAMDDAADAEPRGAGRCRPTPRYCSSMCRTTAPTAMASNMQGIRASRAEARLG